MSKPQTTLGEKLQAVPKHWLYGILLLVTSIPLLFPVPVPNLPSEAASDFFKLAMTVPVDKPVLIGSDWTNSTRGESAGEFKALVRILMRRGVKFAIYSSADSQAPQVAKDAIRELNSEFTAYGQKPYEEWNDWVSVGYFPNAEGTANVINEDVRSAFGSKKDIQPGAGQQPVFNSPVLQSVHTVADFSALFLLTASNTSTITIQRITKVQMAMAVTGVMGPETEVYYTSHQLKGLLAGLKGVYDIETLMQSEPKWADKSKNTNLDFGAKFYPPLQLALVLLIVAIITGNVGMIMSKKAAR